MHCTNLPHIALATVLLIVMASGCNSQSSKYSGPKLTPDDVVTASDSYLANQDVDRALYNIETVGFNFVDRTWHVSFQGTQGVLHDYFWIKISDNNIDEIEISGR